jgi:8-oxo-dGTP pyrophosphatase MutT (NUDIX family)
VKPLRTEVVFATPWFEVVGKTMRTEEEPYYSLRLPDYACVVALTEDERILLVRQYRPAIEMYSLELPSGLIDPGETPAQAAHRELLEETAYQAAEVEVLGPMHVDSGRLSNRMWNCVARGARRVEGRAPEAGIEVVTCSPEELWQAALDGRFSLSLHAANLMHAVLRGQLKLPGSL